MFDKIECEIFGLSSSPSTGNAYVLLLREIYGNRRLPIIIGQFEAQAIAMELEGMTPPRPLTHDLLKSIIINVGASVQEIIITELKDNTFLAKIVIEMSSLTNEIDSRPSDAIALAIRTNSPIYVAENVMKTAAFIPSADLEKDTLDDDEYPHKESGGEALKTKEARISALQNQLREAIDNEDYERASKIRDEIKNLSGSN